MDLGRGTTCSERLLGKRDSVLLRPLSSHHQLLSACTYHLTVLHAEIWVAQGLLAHTVSFSQVDVPLLTVAFYKILVLGVAGFLEDISALE